MGGSLVALLSFLLLCIYSVASIPLLAPRTNSASSSGFVCPARDASGNALADGSADSLDGSTPVYFCVYANNVYCKYLPTDGTLYAADGTCPAALQSVAAPPSSGSLGCAPTDISGHAMTYAGASQTQDGTAVYQCVYADNTYCDYLPSGSLLEDDGDCPATLISGAPNLPSSSSSGGGSKSGGSTSSNGGSSGGSGSNGGGGTSSSGVSTGDGGGGPTTTRSPESTDAQISSVPHEPTSSASLSGNTSTTHQAPTNISPGLSTQPATSAPTSNDPSKTPAPTWSVPPTWPAHSLSSPASASFSVVTRAADSARSPASPAATSSPSFPSSLSAPSRRTSELPGDAIGLIVAGCAVFLGLVCFAVWRRSRTRRRPNKLAAEPSPPSVGSAHNAPFMAAEPPSLGAAPTDTAPCVGVAARSFAKSLAAVRRDVLSTPSSGATPITPALSAALVEPALGATSVEPTLGATPDELAPGARLVEPALGSDAFAGLLATEVRRALAEYGAPLLPPPYVESATTDANAGSEEAG